MIKITDIKNTFGKLLLLFFLINSSSVFAQDINANSPKPAPGSHQQRAADKKKLEHQKENSKGIEEGKKQHEKMQTKNTKKMMRKSKRDSKRWNENKKEPFFKRLFTKKHH